GLRKVVLTACFEDKPEKGFEILDRMVAVGARMDGQSLFTSKYQIDFNGIDRVKTLTSGRIPSLDEVLDTPEQVQDYVDRLVATNFVAYGNTIKRGQKDGPWKWSPFAHNP